MGRVIARPYVGNKPGEFRRTSNRHDYALKPTAPTALNVLKDAGLDVIAIGKINDISAARASRSRSTPTAPSTAWNRPSKRRAGL